MRMSLNPESHPIVSVIIPCYNHGKYLAQAIDSVSGQTYPHHEIVVVDDGSKDNTQDVAKSFPSVKYIYQDNQGLSAARNTGIAHSSGAFLVFLDADDWLFPDALALNIRWLLEDPNLAFVSGAHRKVNFQNEVLEGEKKLRIDDYYRRMLQGNYIEMHATVMYARWIFDHLHFDVTMKACEDYDLYLKILRKHPVKHHEGLIAAYRFHNRNMSGNGSLMLTTALEALRRQYSVLETDPERKSWQYGRKFFKDFYGEKMLDNILSHTPDRVQRRKDLVTLLRYPSTFFSGSLRKLLRKTKKVLIRVLPFPVLKYLHKVGMHKNFEAR